MNTMKILALNPGSRYLGVALLYGPDLREWRVKTIPGKWSAQKVKKAQRIIADLLYLYQPTVIAMKQLHPARSSENLNQLAELIRTIAKSNGLSVHCYSLKQMKTFFSEEKKIKSKRQLANKLCSIYPALYPELQREREHKNRYYTRMFEAVGLGTICFHQLEKQANAINS